MPRNTWRRAVGRAGDERDSRTGNWTDSRTQECVLFAFGVAIALYGAYPLRAELVVNYVSALFAVVLMPLVRAILRLRIGRWHPGRAMAVLIMLVLTVGVLTLFFVFGLAPAMMTQSESSGGSVSMILCRVAIS